MPDSRQPLRVAVVMDRREEIQMSLWFHAQRVLRESGPCVFSLFSPQAGDLRRLAQWRADGVLGYVQDEEVMSVLLKLGCAVVNTSGALGFEYVPTVCPDNDAIGRLAGEHLREKNCRHFGFVGVQGHRYSELQQRGFVSTLGRADGTLSVFDGTVHPLPTVPPTAVALRRNRPVVRWLKSLPDHTGLLIADSWLGMRICDLASASGMDLLSTLAIVTGHDCDVPSVPSLSGVHISEEQWSRQAVTALLEVLAGQPEPDAPILIQPTSVNERESSARTMVRDPALREALRFIHARADSAISVDHVARSAAVGRRSLERRFRAELGRTVLGEIHRTHIEQAKRLLIDTDLAMPAVARMSGLRDDRHLLRLFHRYENTSPGAYRQRFRVG